MKLNTNAKELLALYNVLYERFESSIGGTCYADGDERATNDKNLHELYKRVKACLIASLSNKAVDPLDSWIEGQNRRIGELHRDDGPVTPAAVKSPDAPPVVMSAEDTEVLPDSYPRKGHPQRPQFTGKPRGHRR